ncbi:MAG: RNA polymerase sigma factor [Wenzhouxiangellaceae bacterium]
MADDRTIISDAVADRPGGFERLVDRYSGLVWHIVHGMVRDRGDALDLCQETFIRIHRCLGQFRFESSLATWIGRIAYNVAVRSLERKRLPLTGFDEALVEADPALGPEALADRVERADRVHALLDLLTPLQRTVVTLYHLDELPVSEVAEIVGVPTGTVKSHLFRARNRMREQLDAEEAIENVRN